MLFHYGTTFCIFAIYCSGVAARPGSFVARAYSNTTSSSLTTASSSSTATLTTPSLSSVDPPTSSSSTTSAISLSTSSSTTSLTSIPGRIFVITSSGSSSVTSNSTFSSATSSNTRSTSTTTPSSSSPSTISLSTTSSLASWSSTTSKPTSSFSVTSGRNSSTRSTGASSSHYSITSSTNHTILSTTTSLASSNSTFSTSTGCHPITTIDFAGSICISYCETQTSFVFAPNTTSTVTQFVTILGNSTTLQQTQAPGPTQTLPPQPCFTLTFDNTETSLRATFTNTGTVTTPVVGSQPTPTIISLITSKTTVISFVTASQSLTYGGVVVQDKSSVVPIIQGQNPTTSQLPPSTPTLPQSLEANTPDQLNGNPTVQPTTVPANTDNHSSATVVPLFLPLPGSSVIIGSITVAPNAGTTAVTVNGNAFTVNPSQVIGPGTTIPRPTPKSNPEPTSAPSQTVVNGVTIAIGSSIAIIDSSTYNIGPGAFPTKAVILGQTISIGPNGVGIGSTTLQPGGNPAPPPTQIATLPYITLTQIGSTLLLGTQTFTVGPAANPTTVTVNGQTYTIGPNGVSNSGTTVFQPQNANPAGPTQVLTAAGVTFSEIGSSIVVLGSQTITLGALATPTTEIINGQTISIGPSGVGIAGPGGTTIAPPAMTTNAITAGGITFSEVGPSLVVIGSSTFTIGPGATPTTDVYQGVTVSLGPGGVGFASTTVAYVAPSATRTGTEFITTNGAWNGREFHSWRVLVLAVLLGAWALF